MLRESTLSSFIEYWITEVKGNSVKSGTLSRLKVEAKALEKFDISKMRVCDIRLHHIQKYVNELVDVGYSYNTITKQRHIVTAPLRYAFMAEIIDRDCTQGVEMPAKELTLKPEREVLPLTEEEQELLVATLRADSHPAAPLLEFILESGLRVGEAQALSWRNIDFKRQCMTIRATALNTRQDRVDIQASPKTRSSVRTIPLSTRAMEILSENKKEARSEFVFTDETANPLNYGRIAKRYKHACKAAGVQHCGVHSLRHTFATNCYYKGCDIKILSKLLGHSSTNITYNTYINLYGEGLDEMRKIVN